MLDEHNDLLRERAAHYLGHDTAEVAEAVARTRLRMLGIENPHTAHGLGDAFQVLRDVCRFILNRRVREGTEWTRKRAAGVPVEPRLGPLEGPILDAVRQLLPHEQKRLFDAATHKQPADIAREEGVSPAVVRMGLLLSRRKVREWMRRAGHELPAALFVVCRRVRLSMGEALHLPSTAALAPVLMWSLFGGATSAPIPTVAFTPTAVTVIASQGPPARANGQQVAAPRPGIVVVAERGPSSTALPSDKVAGRRAADETPEDVTISSAATPPTRNGAVVAIGTGHTCVCSVLLRSLDGGTTWTATDGPPTDVSQLVLPPGYPSDPRIFGGVSPADAEAPYISAGFGAPYHRLTGLPAGLVATSADFDQGDERIFSSALSGVWSLRLGTHVPRQEIAYAAEPLTSNAVAALATPSPGGPAVLAWAPADSVVPGSLTTPSFNSALFACSESCVPEGSPGNLPRELVVDANSIIAYDWTSVAISEDGGVSFKALPLPPDAATLASTVVVGRSLWVSYTRRNNATSIAHLTESGTWADATNHVALLGTHLANLVAVDRNRILAVLFGAGYRCTSIGTGEWLSRCPAA